MRKRTLSMRQTRKYIYELLNEEYFRREAEKPGSFFIKKTESQMRMDDVRTILNHLKTVPIYLYKYRVCNQENFDALKKECVWVSSAGKFVDAYDCRIPLSVKKLSDRKINRMMKWFVFSEYIYGYKKENLAEFECALTPKEARDVFFSRCYDSQLFLNAKGVDRFVRRKYKEEEWAIAKEKIDIFDSLIARRGRGETLRKWYREDCEEGCRSSIEMNKKTRYVCSLTETYNNAKMWEEYADRYTGFCIRYDFSQGVRWDLMGNDGARAALMSLLPVFYLNKRPSFPSERYELEKLKSTFYESNDEYWPPELETKLMTQMLIKNPDYTQEQEWRILISGEDEGLVYFPFSTGIYLGKDITSDNKEKLLQIAEERDYCVYQQQIGADGYRYERIREEKPKKKSPLMKVIIPNKNLL